MIKKLFFLLLAPSLLLSCSDDDSQSTPTSDYLVIGDSSADVLLNITTDVLYKYYDPDHNNNNSYLIDLDDNGEDDFRLDVLHSPSMTNPLESVRLKSLHADALFVKSDTTASPEVLNVNDSLMLTANCVDNFSDNDPIHLHYYSATNPPFQTGTSSLRGLWKNADHKNLGLMVKKTNTIVYGWAELSINYEGLRIHKIASKPCLY